jgi:hypothetical protein
MSDAGRKASSVSKAKSHEDPRQRDTRVVGHAHSTKPTVVENRVKISREFTPADRGEKNSVAGKKTTIKIVRLCRARNGPPRKGLSCSNNYMKNI